MPTISDLFAHPEYEAASAAEPGARSLAELWDEIKALEAELMPPPPPPQSNQVVGVHYFVEITRDADGQPISRTPWEKLMLADGSTVVRLEADRPEGVPRYNLGDLFEE